MKTKLTLTIDPALLPAAKRYARRCGRSLSGVVEDSLRAWVGGPSRTASFVDRWRGKFVPARRDTPLYRALARKYL
jgi:hypothetical protein